MDNESYKINISYAIQAFNPMFINLVKILSSDFDI